MSAMRDVFVNGFSFLIALVFAIILVFSALQLNVITIEGVETSVNIQDTDGNLISPATEGTLSTIESDVAQENTLSSILSESRKIETDTGSLNAMALGQRGLFGEQKVVTRDQLIDLVSTLGTSVIRDRKFTQGTGNIPSDPTASGEIKVETGSQSGSWAVLETADQGRYTPGQAAQAGIGLRTLKAPTGGESWKAGYFDENSGFYFGQNATCLYVAEKRNDEINQFSCRDNWNGENITEELGRSWDPTDGTVFQIDYSWYGYGVVLFSIVETQDLEDVTDIRKTQQTVVVHAFTGEGNTSISDPIEPIRVNVSNGNTASNYEVRVGGRQYSILGDRSNTRRLVSDGVDQVTVGSTDYQCLAVFKKSGSQIANNTEIKFQGISAIADGNARFSVLYNANISPDPVLNPLTNTPKSESALRTNTSGCKLASVSGRDVQFAEPNGTKIFGALASGSSTGGGSPGQIQQGDLNFEVPGVQPIVVVAKSVDGTDNIVSMETRFVEKR